MYSYVCVCVFFAYAYATMRMLLLLALFSAAAAAERSLSLSLANLPAQNRDPATVYPNDSTRLVYVQHLTRNEKKSETRMPSILDVRPPYEHILCQYFELFVQFFI